MQSIQATGYSIHFNQPAYSALNDFITNSSFSTIFVIADTNTNELCTPLLLQQLETNIPIEIIEVEAGESSKDIATCSQLWNVLTELGADRKCLIINLGGGMISDLGGFVASTFKRGVAFIHVPTTLLAMVDAAVGGKNGVDLGNLKNQIGVINPPKMVVIDTAFLETLPQNQMRSGLAEMLKHGLIYDAEYWKLFTDLTTLDYCDFDTLIYRSVEIKNEIVTADPKENNIRKSLNFGHTLGHAIESHFLNHKSQKPLLHGEAIAVGMVLEAYLSKEKKLLTAHQYIEIKTVITELFGTIPIDKSDVIPILSLLIHDKKNEYGNIRFALLDGIGRAVIDQETENEVIKMAFNDYKS